MREWLGNGDGDRGMWGRLGMDSKFAGMDGDGDKSLSPCKSLVSTRVDWHSTITGRRHRSANGTQAD